MKTNAKSARRRDFLILIFVLGVTALGAFAVRALLYGGKEDAPPARIVIHIEGVDESLASGIHEGERVIDRTNRRLLGTVSDVRRTPTVAEIALNGTSETVSVERSGRVDIDVTLIPDHDHSGFFVTPRVWSVGTSLTFATPSLAAVGTIIRIER